MRIAEARGDYVPTYDETTGQVTEMRDPEGGVLSYIYDGALLLSERYAGASHSASVSLTYDDSLRPTFQTVTASGFDTVAFTFDPDDLLLTAGEASHTHDPTNGLLTTVQVGDTTTALAYNGFGEPTTMSTLGPTGLVYEEIYERDALGRLVETVESSPSGTTAWSYTYDPRGRLVEVRRNGLVSASYSYDGNGNRKVTTPGALGDEVCDEQESPDGARHRCFPGGGTSSDFAPA